MPKIPCDLTSNELKQEVLSTEQAQGPQERRRLILPAIQASLDRLLSAQADFFKIQGVTVPWISSLS